MKWPMYGLLWLAPVLAGVALGDLADRAFYAQVVLGGPGGLVGDGSVAAFGVSFIYRPLLAALASLVVLAAMWLVTLRVARARPQRGCLIAILVAAGSLLVSIAYSLSEWTMGRFLP